MLHILFIFLLVICDTEYNLGIDSDFVTEKDKTNVKKAIDVYDNIKLSTKCSSLLSDGTELVEKEKHFNTGILNFKLFVRLTIALILFYFCFILIIVESFDQYLINIQYDIASEFIEEQSKSQNRELNNPENNPEVTEEGKI